MKTIHKRAAGLLAAAATVALLAGCGSTNATSGTAGSDGKPVGDLTIGFLQRQLDAPYYTAMQEEAKAVAKEQGFKLLVQNAGGDPVTQLNQAQTMLSQGADVIVANVLSPSTEKEQFQQIADQVPVVFLDTGIPGVGVTSVTSDNVKSGELSGEIAAGRLEKGSTVKVGVLNGGPNDEVVGPARQKGFLQGLETAGIDYDVVASTSAVYAQDKAVPATESMLAAHPDIDLVLGLNDSMALGALTVLQDQGNTTALVAAASDGQKEALQAIQEGCDSQYVSTGLNSPNLAAERAFEIAVSIGTGESKASSYDDNEYTKAAGIGCENVDDYYDPESTF